jgi:hypothetical protein
VGTKMLYTLWACVKVIDCGDPSSVGTLTCVNLLEMFCESAFATVSERFAIADCFFYFGEDN